MPIRKEVRVPVRGWLTPGKDDVLIAQWEGVANGKQSEVIREALECYFQMPPSKRRNPLARIVDDLNRILKLIEEIRVLINELKSRPVIAGPMNPPPAEDPEIKKHAEVRTEAMKKKTW